MPEELPLTERYKRYKRGTEKITSWLSATASKYCDISQLVSALGSKTARKTAAQGGTVEILAAELVSLSVAIIERTPPVAIPAKILTALTKTIEGRQAVADIYKRRAEKTDGEGTGKDSGHQHFIGILIEVKRNLDKAACTFQSRAEQHESATHNHNDSNIVEDNIAAFEPELDGTRVLEDDTSNDSLPSRRSSLSKTTFVLKKQDHEDVLACLCFLDELREVRLSVNKTWQRYRDGEVTFMLASMAIHAAVCLMKCAEEEFVAVNPKLDAWQRVVELLQIGIYSDEHQPIEYLANDHLDGPLSQFQDLDIANLLAYTGSEAIALFTNRIDWYDKNQTNLLKGIPRTGPSKKKHMFQRTLSQHPFVKILLDNLFTGNIAEIPDSGRRNEFFAAIYEYCQTSVLPTWLVVACQMHIDIADILGPQLNDGLAIFEQALRGIEAQKIIMAVLRQQHPGGYPELDDEIAAFFGSSAALAKEARETMKLDTSIARRGDVLSPHYREQNTVLIRMTGNFFTKTYGCSIPTETGCAAFTAKLDAFYKALHFPQSEMALHTMAFLYQAARSFDLLSPWPDMEFLIDIQSHSTPLAPKSNGRPGALFEAYQTSLGLPGIRTIRRVRGQFEKLRLPKVGMIEPRTKIAEHFGYSRIRYANKNPLPLNKQLQIFLHDLTTQRLETFSAGLQTSNSGSIEKQTFRPAELLSTFTEQLQSEEPIIHFDYLRFYADCATLLSKIAHDVLDPRFSRCDVKTSPAMLVGYDLMSGVARLWESPEKAAESRLADAAKVMLPHIRSRGDCYTKAAQAESSSHLLFKTKPLPSKVGCLTEEQIKTVERVKMAGSSISTSGGVAVVYHTRLTGQDLNLPAERRLAGLKLPAFMYEGEEPLPSW
ncbi:hypothetical protein TI39_contig4164g00011 [Zymoseptoria brevis]|uniref:DUF6604 domain-containing protein n=1 Tax=Zymoseptoria brevis TaxID=1047168 RepID=A0A0F4GBC8_9PEZI|nr:hypothetical protein TI39_contig4164g00011 [Zymoseptoria brevis]